MEHFVVEIRYYFYAATNVQLYCVGYIVEDIEMSGIIKIKKSNAKQCTRWLA